MERGGGRGLTISAAVGAVVLLASAAVAQEAPWPTDGWATSTPEEQGMLTEPLASLHEGVLEETYGHIDRLVVVKDGYLVMSERYENDYREASRGSMSALGCGWESCRNPSDIGDYNYLHPDVHPYYHGRDVHSLQSVTKSVSSTVIGVAIAQRKIAGAQTSLLSFFGDYDLTRADQRLHAATLEDLLTMRSGIEWHETDRPMDDTNTTLQLEGAEDWIQFTLNQPMDADPGEKWAYNSGGSHLMSGIIRRATGVHIDIFAEEQLFRPLGIGDYVWKKTPKGYPDTEGGLYLEAEDLAKIGYLYLNDGMWAGQRILPLGWVEAATAKIVSDVNPLGWGYGYQWWRLDRPGTEIWAGLGFGGQYLLILPEHGVIGVVNSWNLFEPPKESILGAFVTALIESTNNEPESGAEWK